MCGSRKLRARTELGSMVCGTFIFPSLRAISADDSLSYTRLERCFRVITLSEYCFSISSMFSSLQFLTETCFDCFVRSNISSAYLNMHAGIGQGVAAWIVPRAHISHSREYRNICLDFPGRSPNSMSRTFQDTKYSEESSSVISNIKADGPSDFRVLLRRIYSRRD